MFSKGGLLELLESSSYFKVTKIRTHIWPVWPSYTLSYNALLHIQVIHTFPPPGYLKTFCATICKLPSAAFPITKGELFFYQKVCAQWSQFPGTPSTSLGNSLTPSIPGQGKMTRRSHGPTDSPLTICRVLQVWNRRRTLHRLVLCCARHCWRSHSHLLLQNGHKGEIVSSILMVGSLPVRQNMLIIYLLMVLIGIRLCSSSVHYRCKGEKVSFTF